MSKKNQSRAPSYSDWLRGESQYGKLPKKADLRLENLEAAIDEEEDTTRMLEQLDMAPGWVKKQPDYKLIRATTLLKLGLQDEALELFLELERTAPHMKQIDIPLTFIYGSLDFVGHVYKAAQRALAFKELDETTRSYLEVALKTSEQLIRSQAGKQEISFENMLGACIFNERAQLRMKENKLLEAENLCLQAIKVAPCWSPPHNNRAVSLYFSGQIDEAMRVLQWVTEREPDNAFSWFYLVIFNIGLDRVDQASECASHLGAIAKKQPVSPLIMGYWISALALLQDTPALWDLAKKYKDEPAGSLSGTLWACLAVASIRHDEWKAALSLARNAKQAGTSQDVTNLLLELEKQSVQRKPRLSWMPPQYPGADLLIHAKVLKEMQAMIGAFSNQPGASHKRELDNFIQKYPFVLVYCKRLLWTDFGHEMATFFLIQLKQPDANAELMRFALSQTGTLHARLNVLQQLSSTENYTGPTQYKVWNEDLMEWRDVSLHSQRVESLQPNSRTKATELIRAAAKTGEPEKAIALLRQAVELEPENPVAMFNLGVTLSKCGRSEEGEALIYRSVELDPNYAYGHASIALTEANMGHENDALDHLQFITRTEVISPETAVTANAAWFYLSLYKHKLTSARQYFEVIRNIAPDYPPLTEFETLLEEAEQDKDFFDNLPQRAQQMHNRLLQIPLKASMTLRACLGTNIKTMLVASCDFHHLPVSGTKDELVSRLVAEIKKSSTLRDLYKGFFSRNECAALRWLLEAEGVRPWEEFARKYGDDREELVEYDPISIPGRLRLAGILFTGQLAGETVAFVPVDLRQRLHFVMNAAKL